MAEEFDQVLLKRFDDWLGEQIKAKNIFNQNGANQVWIHAVNVARELGIPSELIEKNVTPFPSTQVGIHLENPGVEALARMIADLREQANAVSEEPGGSDISTTEATDSPSSKPLRDLLKRWTLPALVTLLGSGLSIFSLFLNSEENNPTPEPAEPPAAVQQEGSQGHVGLRIE